MEHRATCGPPFPVDPQVAPEYRLHLRLFVREKYTYVFKEYKKMSENQEKIHDEKSNRKGKRPFYRKKIFGAVLLLVFAFYFCLVPSSLRISPETTGITDPLTPRGEVDYFRAFEELYIDDLVPPEENGLRLMIAACGPGILEQRALVESVPWERIPYDDISKEWFESRWVPLCDHLYIDPYRRPPFLYEKSFYSYVAALKEKQREEKETAKHKAAISGKSPGENTDENPVAEEKDEDPEGTKLWEKLRSAPWTAEEHPEIEQWVREYSPVLDYYGMCIRKPHYASWRARESSLWGVLLPDVQASREFARSLAVRITERIGRDDLEGAWEDIMSMMYHSRKHYKKDPIFVTNLVGISIEGIGCDSARTLIQYGNPTAQQLEKFARDLDSLPKTESVSIGMHLERFVVYEMLQILGDRKKRDDQGEWKQIRDEIISQNPSPAASVGIYMLPIDRNIAGKRLTELMRDFGVENQGYERLVGSNPTLRRQKAEKVRENAEKLRNDIVSPRQWLRVPLIRTRSRLVAESIFLNTFPSLDGILGGFDRSEAQYELLRIAVALERFQREHQQYPESLEELVPKYLQAVPMDPCTGRATITYLRDPHENSPYLIYSFGENGLDNGGLAPQPESTFDPKFQRDDIVFRR